MCFILQDILVDTSNSFQFIYRGFCRIFSNIVPIDTNITTNRAYFQ